MEALAGAPLPNFEPNTEKIKRHLLKYGVEPTPKIIHTLRKKEIQKHRRRQNRLAEKSPLPPITDSQRRALAEESSFQAMRREFVELTRARPWERRRLGSLGLLGDSATEAAAEEGLRREELVELKEMFELRRRDELRWVLDDDVELKEEWLRPEDPPRPRRSRTEAEVIRFLVDRICGTRMVRRDWKLPRMMKQSGLQFTEGQLLRIVGELGSREGCWERALSIVEWVYDDKDKKRNKSRFVYTKLLAILGKARRPEEALKVFNKMLGDCYIYPDIAAYHSIVVTLGQAGRLKDLIKTMEIMRQKPSSKRTKNMHFKNWDPVLQPDVVVYNAVLNACIPCHQWKGVSWVFKQLRASGLKPNGATYGLAMEVMLQSGKFDLVHEYFRKMRKSRETPNSLTYRVLIRAFSSEGKVNEAVEAVREMEERGVVGASSVYYQLACCLCSSGRLEEAMLEVEKMKKLSKTRPLEVTFTGMITASMRGGHINNCISIFQHMKTHCSPNIGTLNIMLKVYGRNDMFSKAKSLFEEIKKSDFNSSDDHRTTTLIVPDEYTYASILDASAIAQQWEYFEHVYREMVLAGYQLDQSKYSSLLLEASRVGKPHLLEHSFDAILKAGEIPNPDYFTELLLQATARHDYDRSIVLVSTMALAPFQFGEVQWKELFEKNVDRISRLHLEELLGSLDNCDIKSEPTVVHLSRALNQLCESDPSRDLSRDKPLEISVGSEETIPGCSEEWIDEKDSESDVEDHFLYSCETFDSTNRHENTAGFAEDDESDDFGDPSRSDIGFEALPNGVGDSDSDRSNLPSANEVLEAWNETWKKDVLARSIK